jgi:ubiquinone/menaquinone biosynthesis C-methylase UbiE
LESLTITEPDVCILKRLQANPQANSRQALILRASAEDLPVDDDTFDTVVFRLALCGVDDRWNSPN